MKNIKSIIDDEINIYKLENVLFSKSKRFLSFSFIFLFSFQNILYSIIVRNVFLRICQIIKRKRNIIIIITFNFEL